MGRMAALWGPAVFMFGAVGGALAQDTSYFDKGSWTLQLSGGYYNGITFNSDEKIGVASLGGGYYLFDRFALNLALDGYYFDTELQSGFVGGGFTVLARYHFLTLGDRFTVYVDGGAGMVWADEEIPDFGTHFNFTPQVGLGLTYRLYGNVHLFGGGRWFHISNAAIDGRDRNPGVNAVGGYVGVMLTY